MEGLLVFAVIILAMMYHGQKGDYKNLERRFKELDANRIQLNNAHGIAKKSGKRPTLTVFEKNLRPIDIFKTKLMKQTSTIING